MFDLYSIRYAMRIFPLYCIYIAFFSIITYANELRYSKSMVIVIDHRSSTWNKICTVLLIKWKVSRQEDIFRRINFIPRWIYSTKGKNRTKSNVIIRESFHGDCCRYCAKRTFLFRTFASLQGSITPVTGSIKIDNVNHSQDVKIPFK